MYSTETEQFKTHSRIRSKHCCWFVDSTLSKQHLPCFGVRAAFTYLLTSESLSSRRSWGHEPLPEVKYILRHVMTFAWSRRTRQNTTFNVEGRTPQKYAVIFFHRFESRWSPDNFQASSFQLLKLENLLRWSLFTLILFIGDKLLTQNHKKLFCFSLGV